MSRYLKYKKANAVLDSATVLVWLLIIAILFFVGYKVYDNIQPVLLPQVNSSVVATNTLTETHDRYPTIFDGLFIFVFIGLWTLAIVGAFMIDSHPIFMVFAIILLVFIVIASVFMQNYWENFQDSEFISSVSASFPMTSFIMSHLVIIIVVIGMSILITLYAKSVI
jgi:hypothetical protein